MTHLPLLIAILIFLAVIMGIALFSNGKMETEEDFLVGGRSFNIWLTTFCLFSTWFGAGTLITATDEIAHKGLVSTALEPYGAGMCLILAGLFFAKPLWDLQLLTFSDFYRLKFGPKAEMVTVLLTVPTYVGWIAVQLIALSQILSTFFPLPSGLFIVLVALISLFLTITGGIWSVSLTDSFQMFIIVLGLVYLFCRIAFWGNQSFDALLAGIPKEYWVVMPLDKFSHTVQWFGVFCVAALGNLTGQDLGQRIFSAKSAQVAKTGTLLAGVAYMLVGSLPVFFGLTAFKTLGPNFQGSVIPLLIKNYLDPISTIILMLTILSVVLSTITSALLAPASVLAHNLLKKYFQKVSTLVLCRYAVLIVTGLSVAIAFMGSNVYGLLESSYAVGLVGFFAPLYIGLKSQKLDESSCLFSMLIGMLFWLPDLFIETEWPMALLGTLMSFVAYYLHYHFLRKKPELSAS
ncbi:sodium:solute symporter [bacterium (Candidatus Blackallbacteria) CG17_big_fil_post_rev_8_21_14_2_50_48_46]|uniref:Sodium:solute symporter n=1 Tax=bacterium (Candidatus Blackallbacteria) CG17_big_fil_post_rev_8_21_14_2_50_48_46 TaxID=2014261 RepID=A0A2M7G477_9BACT|nr:MAG: sodium:solute symporter [bacterium (Candidatus Blackallbacteria) CG18_big_fil_WC_8_21_14_2_50_49_26]PIW16660.1 MAG: sodium:solute symporter [bacterium (Candidatus Blackallbacteria) CG17_big_fil_post_rev_8_21_14_2_50_48_46]PIW46166.1 MAG: sodium:solute symporter [bacterium (Candidatus Blackallbacteria) CG13_big_fil_rev_8_21_14_2_50_49_14]